MDNKYDITLPGIFPL